MVEKIIDAVFLELRSLVQICSIPSKEELMNARIDSRINWNPVQSFVQGCQQTVDSYNEQKLVIETCKRSINSFIDL